MRSRRKILQGVVTSCKMKQTIVVKVDRTKKHKVLKKSFKDYKKFKAHDEKEQAQEGDVVRIVESRPYSKEKKFKLLKVLNRAAVQ